MAINDTLGIPSDIRRSYLPFVPKSDPGFFTFKGHSEKANIITPFSKNLGKLVAYDSGISLTHDQKKAKLELEQYLNYIPSLQIREYMPEPKLTQLFKWIDAFRAGFKNGQEAASEINAETFSLDKVWEGMQNIRDQINRKFQELTMDSAIGLRTVIGKLGPEHFQDMKFPFGSDQKFAVLYAPFILYYRLNTTTTTNIYEIPFDINVSHNTLMHSDGTYGWGAGDAFSSGIIGLKGESLASKLLGLNTLKTNMMPSFNPDGTTKGLDFSIEFTLINDTAEGAANNYIMLHNLFGNNRWLQYGFVQAPASLYDVKVPGANRYFMCKGQFSCTAVGGFRTPSNLLCNKIVESSSSKRPRPKGTMYSFSQAKEQWNKDINKAIENNNKAGELEVQRLKEELAREELKEKIEGTLGVSLDTQLEPSKELTQASTEYQALSDSLDETKNEMARIDNDIFAVETEQNVILGYVGESMGEFSAQDLRGFIPAGAQIISDSDANALQIKEGEGEELTPTESDNLYNYRLSKLADLKDEVDQLNAEKSDVIKNDYAPKSEQFTEARVKLQKLQQNEDNERYIRQQLESGILQQHDTGQELNVQNASQGNVITKAANLNDHNIPPDTYKAENSESLARYFTTDETLFDDTNINTFVVQLDTKKGFRNASEAYEYFQKNENERKKYPDTYKAVVDAYNRVRYDYATDTDVVSHHKISKEGKVIAQYQPMAFVIESFDPITDKNGKKIILEDGEKNIIKESEQQLKNSDIKATSTSTAERTPRNAQLEKREEQGLSRKEQISNQINETIEKTNNRANWLKKTSDDALNVLEAQEQTATQLKQTSGDLDSSANIFVQREYFKIPDAYKVKLQFTSLLPDNFNNFLYGFRNDNLDPVQHYALGAKGAVDSSVFETMFEQLKNYMK